MCYYEQFRFTCGDWKWGNFRQHCQKEYRMGETCGMKLVYAVHEQAESCSMCERIGRKLRRLEKAKADLARWGREPHRFSATIEKTRRDAAALAEEIQTLQLEKAEKNRTIGNPRRR